METYSNILETIGRTPLIKLNSLAGDILGEVWCKVESFNPGLSVKDRIAWQMVEDAEREGKIKPGSTLIECTSGNTGFGIALVAAVKGYRCIFTISDKQSQEKIDMLRVLGAEVIVCPDDVPHDDPKSYWSKAHQIAQENPNSYLFNQYDNLSNAKAHYISTGPEIWEQTQGKITHFISGIGTAGTLCGVGRYLKEQNPEVQVIGVDPKGSIFKEYVERGEYSEESINPYGLEGMGGDFIPDNLNPECIDEVLSCSDKDAAHMARKLVRTEGIFAGWSSGAVLHVALDYAKKNLKIDDQLVTLLPDHGTRYLSKIFSDEWMEKNQML
ncbi:MAG: cysteine synthase family protein [Cytophagales bacterium]|nr:cysteine synthase family protein [Cytophagales bacterium]